MAAQLAAVEERTRDINLDISWDADRSEIVVKNGDGQFIAFLLGVLPAGREHLQPRLVREILANAERLNPDGEGLVIDGARIRIPLEVEDGGDGGLQGMTPDVPVTGIDAAVFTPAASAIEAPLMQGLLTFYPTLQGISLGASI